MANIPGEINIDHQLLYNQGSSGQFASRRKLVVSQSLSQRYYRNINIHSAGYVIEQIDVSQFNAN